MFIEVLYSDLTRKRVLMEEIDKLQKVNVLAIAFSAPDPERPRIYIDGVGYRRIDQKWGYDFYYVLKYWDDNDWWYAIEGIDTQDFKYFHKDSECPFSNCSLRIEHPRYSYWSIVFEGVYVDDDKWEEALKIFSEEIH
jgi:hypothetical protein